MSLDAVGPAANSASCLSCAQIWADPGKYALMGAAAQLGEFPVAWAWPPPAHVRVKVVWEKVIPASLAQLLPQLKPSLAVGSLTMLPSTGGAVHWHGLGLSRAPLPVQAVLRCPAETQGLRCFAVPLCHVSLPS